MSEFRDQLSAFVTKVAGPLVSGVNLELLRVGVRGSEQNPVIEVILDGDRPIEIGDCEHVSRSLNAILEGEPSVSGNFRLDVMSPGLEEPLVEGYQFTRALGKLVEAKVKASSEDTSEDTSEVAEIARGYLKQVTQETIELEIRKPRKVKAGAAGAEGMAETILLKRELVVLIHPIVDFRGKQ